MAESAADGIDFLGDPRLKNGLAYFPGVCKDGKTVLVGNVVQVMLKAPTSGRQYLGYGYLKGLWLFRDDQAYMRIQHLAPVSEGAANDEIAYRAPEGCTGEAAELLVTTQVADLPLSALLGPVLVGGLPLTKLLFQRNVRAPPAEKFVCGRHLDVHTQRVQPLDDAFRLTPLVVPPSVRWRCERSRGRAPNRRPRPSPAR